MADTSPTPASDKKPGEKTLKVRINATLHVPKKDATPPVERGDGSIRGRLEVDAKAPYEEVELPEGEAKTLLATFPGSCEVGKESPELKAQLAADKEKKKAADKAAADSDAPPVAPIPPPLTPSQKPTPPAPPQPAPQHTSADLV
jgi:hypothetical protein